MNTQANESNTLQDLMWEDDIGAPLSLKLSLLEIITENFSEKEVIGFGTYGTVYKGILGDDIVAVKKFYSFPVIEDKTFQREVDCLMRIRHHNIVWFVGYCAETQTKVIQQGGENIFAETREKLLCFEYLHNGSLRSHLTGTAEPCRLRRWHVCYQIIKGICVGLQYLHEKHIIHLDLKPDNILLDDDMVPKIADFGLSRLLGEGKTRTNTQTKPGTRGYMAPEYIDDGEITVKSDIYSLGVIIKHMVMGRRNTEATTEEVLGTWKTRLEQESSQITPLEICYRQIKACVEISESCRESKPQNRPTIEDILRRLEKTEAEDLSVIAATPSVERIRYLSKLMEGLQLVAVTRALVPGPSLPAALPKGPGNTNPVKVSWLDTRSSTKCFMLSSRLLHIEWADNTGYWKWTNRPDSGFDECAELINVYFLAVIGEILTEDLSQGSPYSVYLVYKLASDAVGLKGTQTASVRLYGERTVATSTVSVYPTGSDGVIAGMARPDGWMELKLAEFAPHDKLLLNERKVIVDFREENTGVKKSGLIIEGMEFRASD